MGCLKLSLPPQKGGIDVFTVGFFVCLSVYLSVSNITVVDGTPFDVEATDCHLGDMCAPVWFPPDVAWPGGRFMKPLS